MDRANPEGVQHLGPLKPIAPHPHLPSAQLTSPTSLVAIVLRFAIAIAILLYMSCLVLASNGAPLIGACLASQSHPAPIPDRGALASVYLLGYWGRERS